MQTAVAVARPKKEAAAVCNTATADNRSENQPQDSTRRPSAPAKAVRS
jgi:hypothetical protein